MSHAGEVSVPGVTRSRLSGVPIEPLSVLVSHCSRTYGGARTNSDPLPTRKMRISNKPKRAPLAVAAVAIALAGAGCEKDEPDLAKLPPPPVVATSTTTAQTTTTEQPPEDGKPGDGKPGATNDDKPADEANQPGRRARVIANTVREYVAALDARNGKRVCELLAPGAIGKVKLPKSLGSCAASVRASIGYADPRGLPVWEGAKVASVNTKVAKNDARAVATVVTDFADRNQPSFEDDVVYLVRSGQLWKIAKPSSTFYRAVGIADVPPSVITPP